MIILAPAGNRSTPLLTGLGQTHPEAEIFLSFPMTLHDAQSMLNYDHYHAIPVSEPDEVLEPATALCRQESQFHLY